MPSVSSRRISARVFATVATAAALIMPNTFDATARADNAVRPSGQKITVIGAGWGHGRGMSQYGASAAAKKGLTYDKILAFYYSGTTLGALKDSTMRVWITADSDAAVQVRPVSGQTVADSAGHSVTLPTGPSYAQWRISRSGPNRVLAYRNAVGAWLPYQAKNLIPTRVWYVSNPSTGTVKLAMPGGSTRVYSGKLALRFKGARAITVNYVSMETYLRTVVPAEMPAEWAPEALKAQAVAARTYAAKERASRPSGAIYDICDSSSCQVYKDNGGRFATTDRAIAATANTVVLYKDGLALTQFTNSNGGWAAGDPDLAYLTAKKDPYDPVKTWTKTLTAADFQKAYPAIGTFVSVQVATRQGVGPYAGAGRAATVKITGSAGSVTVSGRSFKSKFGLKETLFSFSSAAVNATKKQETVTRR